MTSTRTDIIAQIYEDIRDSSIFKSDFLAFKGENINPTNIGRLKTPILYAVDTGDEQSDVSDAAGTRFSVRVYLQAIVKSTLRANLSHAVNDALSAIKNLIASDPLTHSAVRKWQYVSSQWITLADDGMPNYASCMVETNLIYYAASGSY